MKQRILKTVLSVGLTFAAFHSGAQEYYPIEEGQPLPKIKHKLDPTRYPNQSGWYPQTVSYAPDESNLLVGACPADPAQYGNLRYSPRCTLIRYDLTLAKWQALSDIDSNKHYESAAYTFDGKAIFAVESGECEVIPFVAPTRKYCTRPVLLNLSGKKIKNLAPEPHNVYVHPSLTRDGKKVLYWGVSNQLAAGMGGGAWDVKELDIERQTTRQITDYQAAFPKTTPRYMPDGKRLMLAAEEYPKRPNKEDFYSRTDDKGVRYFYDYVSKFGRNMTVVVNGPNAPVKPYFPTLKKAVQSDGSEKWEPTDEHMWLIVRDISRDGKLAVFDDRGIGMCFRFIEEPLRKANCFTRDTYYSESASISVGNKKVASVSSQNRPSITSRLYLIDVATGETQLIPLDW